ncbi:MAG: DUF5668 domain-containing protein [Bacteroidetes bacterium]|jgi:uncharacterized membrane protein|nr:DUF5668 domain-containing protein [Bacteroidota bacterium]
MKHQNVFWGILLIAIGTLFLFDRLDIFEFQWRLLGKLWPILIILWGVSILPVKGFFKVTLALLVGALGVYMYAQQANDFPKRSKAFDYSYESDEIKEDSIVTQNFSHALNPETETAMLELDAGAGVYRLEGTTGDLIRAEKRGSRMVYNFRVEELDKKSRIVIKQKNSKVVLSNNRTNRFDIMLNTSPEWSFDLDVGAAELDFDLSPYRVSEIDLDGGAAAIDIKLGEQTIPTQINIDAAASAIFIEIPVSAGCRIKGSTVLSSKTLDDFEKLESGLYETADFENAGQQIFIKIDAAVSSFQVKRY